MMKDHNVHVVLKNDQWGIAEESRLDAFVAYSNRDHAIEAGKRLARKNRSELLVHHKDGSIGERDSYGHDPRDIAG